MEWIASATVDGGINLNVPPGEDQQSRSELVNDVQQDALNIKNGERSQIKDALGNIRETLVKMVREVDRTDRKNGIAGKPHQQHPFL